MDLFQQTESESMEGVLDRITYANEDSGWTVAQLQAPGGGVPVTVVGTMPGVQIGETLRVRGRWVQNKKFGRQFEVERFERL